MKSKEYIVFTNGCFDIIHAGHIHLLEQAKGFGARLIVGMNSDKSVRELKGPKRPINNEFDRMLVLNAIRYVDEVILFNSEEELLKLIKFLKPHIFVKGADYSENNIVGADFVLSNGGSVELVDLIVGKSTTNLIKKSSENNYE